jgi:hypothetical protein
MLSPEDCKQSECISVVFGQKVNIAMAEQNYFATTPDQILTALFVAPGRSCDLNSFIIRQRRQVFCVSRPGKIQELVEVIA